MASITKQPGTLTFAPEGGLWGAEETAFDYEVFLGVGGDSPVGGPFRLGGPVEIWLPFVGTVEVLRAQLDGDVRSRFGLELSTGLTLGAVDATLPFENVGYRLPTAAELSPSTPFRLEGLGGDLASTADFTTEFPGFYFGLDAVFELAAKLVSQLGVLGANRKDTLVDFDLDWRLPLFSFDTDPDALPEDSYEILGFDLGSLEDFLTIDLEGFGPSAGVPTSVEIPLDDVLNLFKKKDDTAEGRKAEEARGRVDEERETSGQEKKSKDVAKEERDSGFGAGFDTGNVATLMLSYPTIDLPSREALRNDAEALHDKGIDIGRDDYDDPWRDGVLKKGGKSDIAALNIDLDNLLYEAFRPIAAGAGIILPPLELAGQFEASFGGFGAGLDFFYNIFDADIEFGLPINQQIDLTPEPLETRLNFFEVDDDGPTDAAAFVSVRLPRLTVYYNEHANFWDEDVAEGLRALPDDPSLDADTRARIARDLALFVDFDEGIPGAFTGQSGSIAGRVVMVDATTNQSTPLTTFPEQTYWLARSVPTAGSDPRPEDLKPRDPNARFAYEVVDTDGAVLLSEPIPFAPAADGIFETRLDSVTAPIAGTDLLEGVPSLDLVYDGREFWVDVQHVARADVANLTTLDFDINFLMAALEFGLGAYVRALGQRFGINANVGPIFEETYELLSTTIAPLFEDRFELSAPTFTVGEDTAPQESWGFRVGGDDGAGGPRPPDDVIDGLADDGDDVAVVVAGTAAAPLPGRSLIDGGDGNDTVTWAAAPLEEEPRLVARLNGLAVLSFAGTDVDVDEIRGVENLIGTPGDDELTGDQGPNRLVGASGDDVLIGEGGDDTLEGDLGDDVLDGGAGDDEAYGDDGDDRLLVSPGADLLDGGEQAALGASDLPQDDIDVVDFSNLPVALSLNLTTGERTAHPWLDADTWRRIEGYVGTALADDLTGAGGRDYLAGGGGGDRLTGEHVPAGASRDERLDLAGDNDRLYGQGGDDTLTGGPGADMLDGGDGTDTADYGSAPTSVFVDLDAPIVFDTPEERRLYAPLNVVAGSDEVETWRIDGQGWRGWAQGDKLRDVENLRGSAFEDILFGDAGVNVVIGGAGNDRLTGRLGDDTLLGKGGDDILWQGAAVEEVTVGDGPSVGNATERNRFGNPFVLAGASPGGTNDDRMDGGSGEDWAIAETPDGGLAFTAPNRFSWREGFDPFALDIRTRDVELRYESPIESHILGSLAVPRFDLVAPPQNVPLSVTDYRDAGSDAWLPVAGGAVPAAAFFASPLTYMPTIAGEPFIGFRRDYGFVHAPQNLQVVDETTLVRPTLVSIEGLVGGTTDDVLVGGAGPDALFTGGGVDTVAAGAGDDRVGGGGQSAQALFSFPGRSLHDPEAGIGSASSTNVNFFDVPDFAPPEGEPQPSGIELVLRDYVALDGPPTIERLRALRDDLTDPDRVDAPSADAEFFEPVIFGAVLPSERMREIGLFDGGGDLDTLDLRFDRGLDFFPQSTENGVTVDLDDPPIFLGRGVVQRFGFVEWSGDAQPPAILLNVENVIGTAAVDRIDGDTADNIIEGAGGGDILDGEHGVDILSYANALEGVDLVLRLQPGATSNTFAVEAVVAEASGDAAGDRFANFEIIRGSELADRLGAFGEDSRSAEPAVPGVFAVGLFDGGDGDDVLIADREGMIFLGGADDDRFSFGDAADAVRFASAIDNVVIDGGPGVDLVTVTTTLDLQSIVTAGEATVVTQSVADLRAATTDPADDGPDPTTVGVAMLERQLTGVEYLRLEGDVDETLRLDNTDPLIAPDHALDLAEDPWQPFAVEITGNLHGKADEPVVVGVGELPRPEVGTVTYVAEATGTRTPLTVGQTLSHAELASLVFAPGQSFALPAGGGRAVRVDASDETELTKALLTQLDDRAASGFEELLGAEFVLTLNDGDTLKTRDVSIAPGDLAGVPLGLATPTDTAGPAITIALGSAVTGLSEVDFADPDAPQLDLRLPQDRFGDAQTFLLTNAPEIGTLRFTDADGKEQVLEVGGRIERTALDTLVFTTERAFVPADAEIAFTTEERLDVVVTAVPAAGRVFNPTIAVPIEAPEGPLGDAQTFTVDAVPEDGTLFWRTVPGERHAVQAGDQLSATQLEALHFTADPARTAKRDADEDPYLDPGFLRVRFSVDDRPPAPVDGVEIDLEVTGLDAALSDAPLRQALSGIASVDWAQWRTEYGGNDHIYGVVTAAGGGWTWSAARALADRLGVGGPANLGGHLATIGSAAENRFVYGLVADDTRIWSGDFGPHLGGFQDATAADYAEPGGGWRWIDDTPWDFSAWNPGEPNDDGPGPEAYLHLARQVVADSEPASYLPTWNDTTAGAARRGFVVEARSVTTDRNDVVHGSERVVDGAGTITRSGDDRIAGGEGDDVLYGRSGADALIGDEGDDRLFGGEDDDLLTGGEGADVFGFGRNEGFNRIVDFTDGVDRLDVGALGVDRFEDFAVGTDRGGTWLETKGTTIYLSDFFPFGHTRGAVEDLLCCASQDQDANVLVEGDHRDEEFVGSEAAERFVPLAGDDVLTGGDGADIFDFGPAEGANRITDFGVGVDRLDLRRLLSVAEDIDYDGVLTTDGDGTRLVMLGTSIMLEGVYLLGWRSARAEAALLGADDVLGISLLGSAGMPGIDALTLAVGDTLVLDDLEHLRYRAPLDATGDDGAFAYEVRDPWAVETAFDPRPADRDGRAEGRVTFDLAAVNDAPRGATRSHVIGPAKTFDATASDLRLQASDPEGDSVAFSLAAAPVHGEATVFADGGFLYTPDPGFVGQDHFAYLASDGAAANRYEVRLEVTAEVFSRSVTAATELDEGHRLLFGLTAQDELTGGSEADRLLGFAGDDWLKGRGGSDDLQGGDGEDRLDGGAGDDLLSGGRGDDVFVKRPGESHDRIVDFAPGDRLDVSSYGFGYSDLTIAETGEDVRIGLGNDSVLLEGARRADIVTDAFIGLVHEPDSDGDGVTDPVDNATLVANAEQRDTDGDGYGNVIDPDLDNNGVVTASDAALFAVAFGQAVPDADKGPIADADFDGNGFVTASDAGIFAEFFGSAPGPSFADEVL